MRTYGMSEEDARIKRLLSLFSYRYGKDASLLFSAPCGVELLGSLTEDHFGKGICAAISRDLLFAAAVREDTKVEIEAEGMDKISFSTLDLENREREKGKLVSLSRGVLRYLKNKGYSFRGVSVFFHSGLLGSGTFSAAFAVALAGIFNHFFFDGKLSPLECAAAGTYAESFTFGKSEAFLKHVAIAEGGCDYVDFASNKKGIKLPLPQDIAFVTVDLEGIFDPVEEIIRFKKDLSAAASFLGKRTMSEVSLSDLLERLPLLKRTLGDRAALSALHFFEENDRAESAARALERGEESLFFESVAQSGVRQAEFFGKSQGSDAIKLILRCFSLFLKEGACTFGQDAAVALGSRENLKPFLREMIRLFGRDRVKTAEFRREGCKRL